MTRRLSIYEKNQLLRHRFSEAELLSSGELPVEYLTGKIDFAGVELHLNSDVLIPRVETEELVDLLLETKQVNLSKLKYLEVGTGSGAITIALIVKMLKSNLLRNDQQFLLTDISDAALRVAKKNAKQILSQNIFSQLSFLNSDLLVSVKEEKFDLIVANLPYVPSDEIMQLPRSVKDFEPQLALDGGKDGFFYINKLLEQILARELLNNNTEIYLEVDQKHDLRFIKENYPIILEKFSIRAITDQFANHRFLHLKK